ncbi:MAG TPA: nucleotide exchange factor GrpE [Gemmatimonadaceae bacterium]
MVQRDKDEFIPGDGAPDSDDAYSRGAARAAGDDFAAAAPAPDTVSSELERRLADAQDRYLRQAAEYDNFRKRTAKERMELTSRAQADLVKQLLDPLDDLSRFAHVDPTTVDPTTVAQGVELVEKKMLKTLSSAGLEAIDPTNQSFDPKLHEAVATEPALSAEDDHVVSRVYQVGYLFNGQLLRPARVVVKQWNG